jgi:hypothetical protein
VAAQRVAPQRAATQVRKLLADLHARGLARRAAGDQGAAGLEHERLHLLLRAPEHGADLVVRHVAQLGEHERGALIGREAAEVAEQGAQVVPALDLVREVLGRRLDGLVRGALAPRAQDAEAAVAGDRVQPRPQLDRLVGAQQVAVGREERVLDGVLGLLHGAEHVAAEGEDAAVMARVHDLEGRFRAAAQRIDESLVRSQPQEARRDARPAPPCIDSPFMAAGRGRAHVAKLALDLQKHDSVHHEHDREEDRPAIQVALHERAASGSASPPADAERAGHPRVLPRVQQDEEDQDDRDEDLQD